MKRLIILIIIIFLFFNFLSSKNLDAAMSDYCVVPPYVVQNVPPNIMIVLDTSGSMFSFAYYDGFNTTTPSDDNDCGNSGTPCTEFLTPGTYPTYQYYGYFNPDYWYTYSGSSPNDRCVPTAPKIGSGISGERAKLSTEWDGNFLNWLTMRRVDIVRKVLTGGKYESDATSGFVRLVAQRNVDCSQWGIYKRITNADHPEYYGPFTAGADRNFTLNYSGGSCIGGGSTAASTFTVGGTTYKVKVRVPSPVTGVLQEAATRARLGLTIYTTSGSGGRVVVDMASNNLSSMVGLPGGTTGINNILPNGYTPLAETLWTVSGYFANQTSIAAVGSPGPRYASGDYSTGCTGSPLTNRDPYNYGTCSVTRYPSCSPRYVLFITDGEPCNDGNLPATLSNYAGTSPHTSPFNCSGGSCPAVSPFAGGAIAPPYCGSGAVAGMEGGAFWVPTTDLRNNGGTPHIGLKNMAGMQNLTLYNVLAFGRGSSLLRYASINGGFEGG